MPVPALSDITRAGVSAFATGGSTPFPALSGGWTARCDCLNPGSAYEDGHSYAVSGAGAAWSAIAAGADNAVGIARLALGTVATNRGSIAGPNPAAIRIGVGETDFAAKVRLVTLSNATNAYAVRAGFIDSVTAESTDGVFFRYTHGANSGKWQAVARANGTETAVDTGVAAVAGAWDLLVVDINAAGTQAVFKIDGATVATITTNIPTGSGRETGHGVMVLRSAGTAAVTALDVDFLETQILFGTAR